MSRYLRRPALAAAPAAAAALSAAAMRSASDPSASDSPSAAAVLRPSVAYRAAPGHLGLARAHPSLGGDLDALLTPEAFILDATHALAAAALRVRFASTEDIRRLRRDDGRVEALIAESLAEDGPEAAWGWRFALALHDAEEGHFEDALDALARLAAGRPSDLRPRLAAAGICYLAGLQEEGDLWVSEIPTDRRENKKFLRMAVLAAALGGAPRAIDGLVGWAAFEVWDLSLSAMLIDGGITFLMKKIISVVLRRSIFADSDKYKDYHKVMVAGAPSKNDLDVGHTVLRYKKL